MDPIITRGIHVHVIANHVFHVLLKTEGVVVELSY